MHAVADADLVAELPQPVAVRSLAEDEQMHVLANDFQQIGGPDGVFHPFVRQERAGQPDQAAFGGQFEFVEDLPRVNIGGDGISTALAMTRNLPSGRPFCT